MTVTWSHNGTDIMTPPNEVSKCDNNATLGIKSNQSSIAGVYQCVFNDSIYGWVLRRNIAVFITSMFLYHKII